VHNTWGNGSGAGIAFKIPYGLVAQLARAIACRAFNSRRGRLRFAWLTALKLSRGGACLAFS